MLKKFPFKQVKLYKTWHKSFSVQEGPPEIKKCYYEALGVPKTATKDQIKESYLKLAKLYHPDRNKACEKYFANVTAAYDTLINDAKRKEYDEEQAMASDTLIVSFMGTKIDLRYLLWVPVAGFVGYEGYKYYDKNFTTKCPVDHSNRVQVANLEGATSRPHHS